MSSRVLGDGRGDAGNAKKLLNNRLAVDGAVNRLAHLGTGQEATI